MKILVVQESDWLRRNPHQQHHMLERLSAQGHQVLVVDYPIRWRDEGGGLMAPRRVHRHVSKIVSGADVTVVRSAMPRIRGLGKLGWLLTNAVELRRAFRTFRPDVVVILGLSNGLIARRMAKRSGVPAVVHLIDALHTLAEPEALRPIAAWVERALLRDADRVVVINTALGAYAERMGAAPDRIERIPTGADTMRFGPHVDGAALRAEYGIAPHEHVLLFSGWLYAFCGLDGVAAAMAAGAERLAGPRLLVVGDGDLMPALRRLRAECLGDRLILAAQQPAARMPQFLAAADLCLLPAEVNDTMEHIVPAKLYEYLATGKPVLASPLPGLQREFGDSAGIRYVDGPEELLAAARTIIGNPHLAASLGAAARRAAVVSGTWESATTAYLDVLMARPRQKAPASHLASQGESH